VDSAALSDTERGTTAQPTLPLDRILVGDCVEILGQLPPQSVDLVFADPPYNLQLRQALWRPNQTLVDAVDDAWDRFDDFAAYDAFTEAWLRACRRVLKPTGTIWVIGTYHNIFRVGRLMQDLGYWILNDVIWVKSNPMPNFRGVRFTNAHETLIWAQVRRGARYTFNYHALKRLNDDLQMRSEWTLPVCSGSERLRVNGVKAHATQKPEALLYRVLLASTHPGDVVLDPFFGSGTTGAVARRLHRHWIGIERDAGYAEVAAARIAAVQPVASVEGVQVTAPPPRRRLPFGALLESGHLQPGQNLYLGAEGRAVATVRADGSLQCDSMTGSIHQVATHLLGAPSNGWEQWYYDDPVTCLRQSINRLREQLRAEGSP